jgi:ubiquitin carboxyl-terminal hydrolase 4/11/15
VHFLKMKNSNHNYRECTSCQTQVKATKKLDLWSLPKVLVIHLKRSLQDQLDMLVEFPTRKLNMNPYFMDPNKKDLVYDLIGVCNHYGTLDGGQCK